MQVDSRRGVTTCCNCALPQQPGTGWATIDAHFAKLSERFGFTAVPREDIADNAAGALIQQRRYEDAILVLEKNRELHPGSAVTWNHLGDGCRALCRWPESKEHYTKAHELAKAMSYSNLSNYVMELSRITQEIEAGRPCTSPTAPRPSVAVPEAILRTYVGEYAFSPTLSIVVTLEEGTLYAQPNDHLSSFVPTCAPFGQLDREILVKDYAHRLRACRGASHAQGPGQQWPGRG